MRILLTVTLVLIFNLTFSQKNLGIKDQTDLSNYIKIYKIRGYHNRTTESFELFQDANKIWKAQHLKYAEDSIVNIKNIVIDTTSRFDEKLWLKILMTDIQYIPDWDKIDYKLKYNKSIIKLKDDLVIFWDRNTILDGNSFLIEIKTNYDKGSYNKIRYPDPHYFLPQLEHVDEIQSVSELLQIINENFKAFGK